MKLEDLVIAARSGDSTAFGALVRRFQDMAFGGAYAWLGDPDEARDAAQDAFIEAWEALDALREPAAFPGWFRHIVRKHADRHLRRRKPTAPEAMLNDLPSPDIDPLAATETRELQEMVNAAVASLPETLSLPLTMFHLEGHRQKDVADFLGLPVSTVKKRIFDARKALKRKVDHMVEETLERNRPSKDDDFARKVDYWIAVAARDVKTVTRLLDEDPSLVEATSDWDVAPELRSGGWEVPAATWAVQLGDAELLSLLLDRGASTASGKDGDSLLHVAAMQGLPDIVRLLVERNVDLDAHGCCRQTPLQRAVIRGDAEIATQLLDAGADPDVRDHADRTAADWAALKGRGEILDLLRERGATTKCPLHEPRRVRTKGDTPRVLESGIKPVDFFAPFPRGGHVGIQGGMGTGTSLLVAQIARNVIETYDARVVLAGATGKHPDFARLEWSSFFADGKLLSGCSDLFLADGNDVDALRRVTESGLARAEALRDDGHEVLLIVDTPAITRIDGVLETLRARCGPGDATAITTVHLNKLPYDLSQPEYDFLDARVRMDVRRSDAALYPAVDLERSHSRLLDDDLAGSRHREAHVRCRRHVRILATTGGMKSDVPWRARLHHIPPSDREEAERLLTRARLLDLFFTQPYHGTEIWMGRPGETVPLSATVDGVHRILDGEFDDAHPRDLYLMGPLS